MQEFPMGFAIVDNAISECDSIIDWINDKATWYRSHVDHHNPISEHRTSSSVNFPFCNYSLPDFIKNMNGIVWEYMNEYAAQFNFYISDVESVSVQRYEPGQKYDLHQDWGSGNDRVLSALVYLNTVEGGGGETSFIYFDDYKIAPIAGRLALFPSSFMWTHEALPPVSDVKYAAAFWAKG